MNASAVLEPLDFVLPKREPVSPVLDLSVELSGLNTTEAEPPAPSFLEKAEPSEVAPEPEVELNLIRQHPQEPEPSHDSAEPRTDNVVQNDAGATTLTSVDDQKESLQH